MWSRLGVLSLALGAAALAAGCADRTAGPTLDAGPAFSRGGESWWGQGHRQGRWRSSSARYSDHGHKPATGRSGSATLTVRALLGRDGTTDVDVTTGELDSPSPAPGTLAKVQVKGFGVDRHLLFVRNYDHLTGFGSASFSLAGLMRGSTVQVQALVRGIDWKRTDVVTVREEVKRRPDLQVADLTVPPRRRLTLRSTSWRPSARSTVTWARAAAASCTSMARKPTGPTASG